MNNTGSGKQAYKPIKNQILRVSKPTEYELLPLSRLPYDKYDYNTKKTLPTYVQPKKKHEKRTIQDTLTNSVNNKKSLHAYGDTFRKLISLPNFKLNESIQNTVHSKKNKSMVFHNLRLEKPNISMSDVLIFPNFSNKNKNKRLSSKEMMTVNTNSLINDSTISMPILSKKSKQSTDKMQIGEIPKNFIDENSKNIQTLSSKNLKNEKPLRLHNDKDVLKNNLSLQTNTNKVSLQKTNRVNDQYIKLNTNHKTTSLVTPKVFQNLSKIHRETGKDNIRKSKLDVQSNTPKKYHQIIKNNKSDLENKKLSKRVLTTPVSTPKINLDGNNRAEPFHLKLNPNRLDKKGIAGTPFIPTKDRDVNVPPSHLRSDNPLKKVFLDR